ncbi:response regulator [Poseidonibacter sp.]|uniref:response regulator n=1 Tax=Poseidonibacter sp. TaxID=2321188 RepID=UPI003C7117BF
MNSNLKCSFKKEFLQTTTILYVESDASIRNEASEIFDGFFKTVIIAVNGKDALEKFVKFHSKIDIIFTDIHLPDISGLEVLEEIRKVDWDIPVLISTAFEKPEILLKLIKFNVTNYIAKPIQLNTTFKIISLLMEEKQRKLDLKRNEYELKQFMSILDSINLVCEINLDGFITYANDLYLMTSGYSLDELSKMNHKMITIENSECENFDDAHKSISRGEVWSGERKKNTKDGKVYYTFSVILPIINNNGQTQKYIEFATLTTKYKTEILMLKKHIITIKTNNFKNDLETKNTKKELEELAQKYEEKEKLHLSIYQKYQRKIDDGVDNAQQTLFELDKSKKRILELEEKLKAQEKRFEQFQSSYNDEKNKSLSAAY